jgi:hypothetical protein
MIPTCNSNIWKHSQEDLKFEASLDYIARLSQNTKTNKQKLIGYFLILLSIYIIINN